MLRRSLDVIFPLFFSVILIGLFVALSSGSVLSASIVVIRIAVSSSPGCHGPGGYSNTWERASGYSEKCCHAPNRTEGCNYFFNQSIVHTEKSPNFCPWKPESCTLCDNLIISFGTGNIFSNILGLNAAERHTLRRMATCAAVEAGTTKESCQTNDRTRSLIETVAVSGARSNETGVGIHGSVCKLHQHHGAPANSPEVYMAALCLV